MGYKDDFFESSLNSDDIRNIGKWEVDRILNTVSTMKKGSSKKQRISDEEVDKILSEKFIPIMQKEKNETENISDDFEEESSDITVIKGKRHKNTENQIIKQNKKSADKEKSINKEPTQKIDIKNDYKDINQNDYTREATKEIKITDKSERKNTKKKKSKRNGFLVSFLSFLCLSLCVMLCIMLISTSHR